MIKFISEKIQTEFHLLPVDLQLEWYNTAMKFMSQGKTITVVNIEHWPEGSEVDVRIRQEFDVHVPGVIGNDL